jgi:hypothetical protein
MTMAISMAISMAITISILNYLNIEIAIAIDYF